MSGSTWDHCKLARTCTHRLADNRHAWVQVIRGAVTLNDTPLSADDGAAVSQETEILIRATDAAELLLVELD